MEPARNALTRPAAAAQLVRCPGAAAAAEGGAYYWLPGGVRLDGLGHSLAIPAGAVGGVFDDTDFTMRRIAGDYLNVEVLAKNPSGKYMFKKSVRLTLDWSRCGLPPSTDLTKLRVYRIDPRQLSTIGDSLPEARNTRTDTSITVLLDSLSNYALATAD